MQATQAGRMMLSTVYENAPLSNKHHLVGFLFLMEKTPKGRKFLHNFLIHHEVAFCFQFL